MPDAGSLGFRFQQAVEELNDQGVGVLFTLDEVDPTCAELIEFISFYQLFVTEKRDVAMLLAGLPGKVSDLLIDDHVSFVRRSFQRRLASIPDDDVRECSRNRCCGFRGARRAQGARRTRGAGCAGRWLSVPGTRVLLTGLPD